MIAHALAHARPAVRRSYADDGGLSRPLDPSESAHGWHADHPGAAKWRRAVRFNRTTGVSGYQTAGGRRVGGDQHPDRCACQGGDTTPHKHHVEKGAEPWPCARCGCNEYRPAAAL